MELELLVKPLVGGVLLGCSGIILMLFNGRIAGISGILGGILSAPENDTLWRWFFLAGMVAGGGIGLWSSLANMPTDFNTHPLLLALAGLFVGFGARIGNGCTSGHGICGIGRLSVRSIVATCVFMMVAGITVFVRLHLV